MSNKDSGFSIIELTGVVTLVLTIALVSAPNLLRPRVVANEAVAVGSLRDINSAAAHYRSQYGNGFPSSLAQIGMPEAGPVDCDHAGLVDPLLTAGAKKGYKFRILPGRIPVTAPMGCSNRGSADSYVVIAIPADAGWTGRRAFCSDASGVIRYSRTGTLAGCTARDNALP